MGSPPLRASGRLTRIRKACDICRLRKVKCDGVSPCRSCQALAVECTFQYVSRHRGPTSRFAAASVWAAGGAGTAAHAGSGQHMDSSADGGASALDGASGASAMFSGRDASFGDVDTGSSAGSSLYATLYTPRPLSLPQSLPLSDALPPSHHHHHHHSQHGSFSPSPTYGLGASMAAPLLPPSPSASSLSSSTLYSTSFFDAMAANGPGTAQQYTSTTHMPHVNIYYRMPRPQPLPDTHQPRIASLPPPPPPLPLPPPLPPPPPPPRPPPQQQQQQQVPHAPTSPSVVTSDSIAPLSVLGLLVDDFFTYIHPLIPFPHEPTFRRRFARATARQAPGFLALLASMVGCLAASYPRSVGRHMRAYRRAQQQAGRPAAGDTDALPFTRAIFLVERCRDVALAARGAAFYATPTLHVDDAATSYFLGLAAGYTFNWPVCRRFMAEAMSFVQELRLPHQAGTPGAFAQRAPAVNHVDDQIGKRIFWVLYLAMRSLLQLGTPPSETPLLGMASLCRGSGGSGEANSTPGHPGLPAEVDDAYIEADVIHAQPAGTVSLLTGFNKVVAIYATMDPIAAVQYYHSACGVGGGRGAGGGAGAGGTLACLQPVPVATQRALFVEALQAVKAVTDTLPNELYLPLPETTPTMGTDTRTSGGGGLGGQSADDHTADLCPHEPLAAGPHSKPNNGRHESAWLDPSRGGADDGADDLRLLLGTDSARRRHLQCDIQKANIYASQLATRSYYVEMYHNLGGDARATDDGGRAAGGATSTGGAPDTASPMAGERERIVQSLLFVLTAIPQGSLEPNGSALINKIRQVASTLVGGASAVASTAARAGAAPPPSPHPSPMEAQLMRFVEILMRLETTGGALGRADGDSAGADSDSLSGDGTEDTDADEELQNWASLREEQMRFAASGGFMGHYGGGAASDSGQWP